MRHLLQTDLMHLTMREAYGVIGSDPTSSNGEAFIVRSWLAYHRGPAVAERAAIRSSRGRTLRVGLYGHHDRDDMIVRVVDPCDHRHGVAVLSE